MDLTGLAKVRWRTKQTGFHYLRPIIKLADGTWLVGDHEKDMQMAVAGGCKPVLVQTGKGSSEASKLPAHLRTQVKIVDDLAAAALFILAQDGCNIS